jgi:hypothetical protein
MVTSSECSPWTRCCRIDGLTVTNEFDHKLEPENSPQPESVSQPQSDRITRWILTAIGIYTGLLVTLLNVFLLGGFWVFVYGLMVYLPACTVPQDRPAKPPRWWSYPLAVVLPFPFVVLAAPVVLLREWLGIEFLPGV